MFKEIEYRKKLNVIIKEKINTMDWWLKPPPKKKRNKLSSGCVGSKKPKHR